MLLAVHYRVMEHLRSLESTQEPRVALGYRLGNSYASFVLSKLPACSITRQCTLKYEPIVKYQAKNTKVEAFFTKKNLREDDQPRHFRLKFQQSVSVKTSYLISIHALFLLQAPESLNQNLSLSYDLETLELIEAEKTW